MQHQVGEDHCLDEVGGESHAVETGARLSGVAHAVDLDHVVFRQGVTGELATGTSANAPLGSDAQEHGEDRSTVRRYPIALVRAVSTGSRPPAHRSVRRQSDCLLTVA